MTVNKIQISYIPGYKLDGRNTNGTMSGGLWIERGPWGSSSATTDDKSDAATPEKLLNLNATPGDYAEVDGPVAPLMPPTSTQAPGTPVAYATTNIIRTRNVSKMLKHVCVCVCVKNMYENLGNWDETDKITTGNDTWGWIHQQLSVVSLHN